ncbi:MAG: hypothetical protein U1E65_26865 [Myxococcota bacterium]
MSPDVDAGFRLSPAELQLLAFTGDLHAEDESPLEVHERYDDTRALERAAKRMVDRALADPETLRPHRELVRRLLIVSQPDARVVLLERDGDGARRALEYYERAGAFVSYKRDAEDHDLGAPSDLEEVLRQVEDHLPTRGSFGDFIDFTLDSAEYFAFSLFAGELLRRQRERGYETKLPTSKVKVRGLARPPREALDDEGTPIAQLFSRLPRGPSLRRSAPDWEEAIASLEAKDLVHKSGDQIRLRPFVHDLAIALAAKHRLVLTRFDFGAEDWIVRDATLVPVPGSLFSVRAVSADTIRVVELTKEALGLVMRRAISPQLGVDA